MLDIVNMQHLFGELLDQFTTFPGQQKEPTYLELCRYPARRLEEIYSRLLAFYLQPLNVHGFETLFLNSLLDLISDSPMPFDSKKINVFVEENAGGKRIDIVVKSGSFIIGIENKLFAGLYNPLDCYTRRLKLEKGLKCYLVVLSVNSLSSPEEKELMIANGFINITYKELFASIQRQIGLFNNFSKNYKFVLDDMIKTIDNMATPSLQVNPLHDFFFDNQEIIEALTQSYEQYISSVKTTQAVRINSIQDILKQTTGKDWWIWGGYDLGFTFNENGKRLGIEAEFVQSKENPFASFLIKVTTWHISHWDYYKDRVEPLFPDKSVVIEDGRANLAVENLIDMADEQLAGILSKLQTDLETALRHN